MNPIHLVWLLQAGTTPHIPAVFAADRMQVVCQLYVHEPELGFSFAVNPYTSTLRQVSKSGLRQIGSACPILMGGWQVFEVLLFVYITPRFPQGKKIE